MKIIKKKLKDYIKVFVAFILGIMVSLIIVDANSNYPYSGINVVFDNEKTKLTLNGNSVSNIQDAIDALTEKVHSAPQSECANGYVKRNSSSSGIKKYTCELSTIVPKTADEMVTQASQLGLENVADAYRYAGPNPANYIMFDSELWRIIGVYRFSNVNYLKIVKAVPLNSNQKYNNSTSTNAWNSSTLKTYLNGTSSSQYYYTLSTDAKNMIYEGTWYVGSSEYNVTAATAYTNAKSITTTQKVGLVASYEYLYAATSNCWTITGNNYNTSCAVKDWLWSTLTNNNTSSGWFINPSSYAGRALYMDSASGIIGRDVVTSSYYIFPTVYLKSTITISGGIGTILNPYLLR